MNWLNDIMNIPEETEDSDSQKNNEGRQVQSEPIGRDTPSGYVGWGTFEDPTGAPIFPNATPPWMYEDPPKTWKEEFISSRGNEYFCEIDEDYLTDRFNLTGLQTEVHYYQHALDLITDVFDLDCEDDMRETIEKSARHLYGLVHARYIVTTRGLTKMVDKFKKSDFGKCPRVHCDSQPLLPMGLSDVPYQKSVKLFCARCEDIYNPKSSRHAQIDGAYFGASFHNILFQVYPALIPQKSRRRYEPKIFGFRVHASAALARWQTEERGEMRKRLKDGGVTVDASKLFAEDIEGEDSEANDNPGRPGSATEESGAPSAKR